MKALDESPGCKQYREEALPIRSARQPKATTKTDSTDKSCRHHQPLSRPC